MATLTKNMANEGILIILDSKAIHEGKGQALFAVITPDPDYPTYIRFATYQLHGQQITCLSISASESARVAYETERSFYRSSNSGRYY